MEAENYPIDDLLDDELLELEGDARQQYWLVVDIPIPAPEAFGGRQI
ncbi:MAG: hypothetical protein ACI9XZ_004344 [Alphaproteobacteria bacterium]|jgi:hypothetical protein